MCIRDRYVAVRLMAKHGVALPYTIPATLTPAKTAALNDDFEKIWAFIMDRECAELTSDMAAFFKG